MAAISKKSSAVKKQRAKRKKIHRKEKEDSEGFVRKKHKRDMSPNVYYISKFALIVLIVIIYFVYSPLLLPLCLIYAGYYFLAFLAERRMNLHVHRDNHNKIFKLDSTIISITILISFGSSLFSNVRSIGGGKGGNMQGMQFASIGSMLTGVRNAFRQQSSFGFGSLPSDFQAPSGGGRPEAGSRPDFSLSDLPLEFAFSQILSSVIQFLIFTALILGGITTGWYLYKTFIYNKKVRLHQSKNEWVFSREELLELLSQDI